MVPVSDSDGTRFDTRVIVVLVFVLLYAQMILDYGIGYRDGAQIDLEPYYLASVVTFEQERSSYGPEAFAGIESDRDGSANPFWYPPPSLLAFHQLSWSSYDVARIGTLGAVALIAWAVATVWSLWAWSHRRHPGIRASMPSPPARSWTVPSRRRSCLVWEQPGLCLICYPWLWSESRPWSRSQPLSAADRRGI